MTRTVTTPSSTVLLPARKVLYPNVYVFDPIGSTPPRSLIDNSINAAIHRALLLGCGDLKSVLFACFCQRRQDVIRQQRCQRSHYDEDERAERVSTFLDFTCCDREASILARNAILVMRLLQLNSSFQSNHFSEEENASMMRMLWSIYHEQFITHDCLTIIHQTADSLLSSSQDIQSWHDSEIGQYIRIVDRETLRRLRSIWKLYADRKFAHKFPKNEVMKKRSQFNSMWEGKVYSDLNSLYHSCPQASRVWENVEAHRQLHRVYKETGRLYPTTEETFASPLFLVTEKKGFVWCVAHDIDCIDGYHLSTLYSDLEDDEEDHQCGSGIESVTPTHTNGHNHQHHQHNESNRDLSNCCSHGTTNGKNSPSSSNDIDSSSYRSHPSSKHLLAMCVSQFIQWCDAFQYQLCKAKNVVLRFYAGDALELCEALSHINSGLYDEPPKLCLPQWSLTPLCLDGGGYTRNKTDQSKNGIVNSQQIANKSRKSTEGHNGFTKFSPNHHDLTQAPTLFDVIDTCCLSDEVGMFNLLIHAGPLLLRAPHSTLFTDTLRPGFIDRPEDIIRLASFMPNNATAAVLLGLSQATETVGYTIRNLTQERSLRHQKLLSNSMVSDKNKELKLNHHHFEVAWKISWTCDNSVVSALSLPDNSVMTPSLATTDNELASAIIGINHSSEPPFFTRSMEMMRVGFLKVQASMCSPHAMLRFVTQSSQMIQSDSSTETALHNFLSKEILATSKHIFAPFLLNEQDVLRHLNGIHTEELLQSSPLTAARKVLRGDPPKDCYISKDTPRVVRIGILIPKSVLLTLENDPLRLATPLLILRIRCDDKVSSQPERVRGADSHFYCLHVAVARKIDPSKEFINSSPDNDPIIHWDNFSLQQCQRDHPDAVLLVSALVPAFLLGCTPKNQTSITVSLDSGFIGLTDATARFGEDLSLFSAPLTDTNVVSLISKGVHSCPIDSYGVGRCPKPSAGKTAAIAPIIFQTSESSSVDGIHSNPLRIKFSHDGKATSFEARVYLTENNKSTLAGRATVLVHQHSSCSLRISIGDKDCPKLQFGIIYPYPIDATTAKLNVSPKKGRLDLTVQPWNDKYPFKPFQLIQSSSPQSFSLWGLNRIILPLCPAIHPLKSTDWLQTLIDLSLTKNDHDTLKMLPTYPRLSNKNPFICFKQTLTIIFKSICRLKFNDAENTDSRANLRPHTPSTPWFAISLQDRQFALILIYVDALRLDPTHSSVLLDVAICPLTKEIGPIVVPYIDECIHYLSVAKAEFELWMEFIPVAIERARSTFWYHTSSCEYHIHPIPSIPLTTRVLNVPCCSCGMNQNLPSNFVQQYGFASQFFSRGIISPLLPYQPEESPKPESRKTTRASTDKSSSSSQQRLYPNPLLQGLITPKFDRLRSSKASTPSKRNTTDINKENTSGQSSPDENNVNKRHNEVNKNGAARKASDPIGQISSPKESGVTGSRPTCLTSTGFCATCGAGGARMVCNRCKSVQYCNCDCQRQHWPAHKSFCNQKSSLLSSSPS